MSTSKKRVPTSPLEDTARSIDVLKEDFTKRKKLKVHFLDQPSTSSPKKNNIQSESEPIHNEDGVELLSGFESRSSSSSNPWSNPVVNVVGPTFDSSIKKKKLKIILHEHSFNKPYNIENINSHLNNFKILSVKEAHTKSSVLICEIDIVDIDKIMDRDNWSEKINRLQIDKRSRLLDSFCVNKTAKDSDIPPISLEKVYENLEHHGIPRVFNLRKEGNLVIFEVVKGDISEEFSFTTKINNLIRKHHVRIYDPVDNYITQCKKCFKFGHIFSACKSNAQLCSWCGKENCSKKCSTKSCVNCGRGHSAFYRGCEVYKKLFEKATITRNDKQKIQKINTISQSVSEVK
eukprot:TCONS_00022605-protein